jgi:RimJ/RimL family protein N-acetyltransferase
MYASLSDNTLIFTREIRPSDKERLLYGLQHLSEESVHKRFLGPKPSLSAAELRYLTEVDGDDHYAIVAVPAGEEERIVAVARYVRLEPGGEDAEAAITVCDELQGKGLGSLLARLISDAARERGVKRITASIASDNKAALRLMAHIDQRLTGTRVGSSVTELVAQLPMSSGEDELADDDAATASPAAA